MPGEPRATAKSQVFWEFPLLAEGAFSVAMPGPCLAWLVTTAANRNTIITPFKLRRAGVRGRINLPVEFIYGRRWFDMWSGRSDLRPRTIPRLLLLRPIRLVCSMRGYPLRRQELYAVNVGVS